MKAQSDKGGSQITFSWMLFVGLMLVAANLRAPFTGVAPVQDLIQLSYNLSAASVGLLTTLPLMAFAVVSPFAATISRRFGVERTLVGAITFVIAGILLRSLAPLWGLYTGTVCIGIGIAIGNVLLPSLIKRDFPGRVPTVTGMSTVTMGLVAALVSVSIVPMASAIGWRAALSANMVFAVLPLLVWMARLRTLKPVPAELRKTPVSTGVWRSPLAWQITVFMGSNSLLYYVLISWLPSILTSSGYSAAEAGSLHGMMQLATALPGLFLGPIISRLKDQRLIAVGTTALMTIAILGLMWSPQFAIVWVFMFGLGSCSVIILSFVFMSLRANNSHQTAALSGMAQSVGYLLAATGPSLAGLVHQQLHSWTMPLSAGVVLTLVMMIVGAKAGRAGSMVT